MSYRHYQNAPGWGTQQYQFLAPPEPTFQPQPSWGGIDYYRAHALNPDNAMYDSAWNRVRNYGSSGSIPAGVGLNEARHWHRKTYGGLSQINMILPEEVGHAAAYEAYRTWIHNSSLYEPLSADDERQREALVGIAVAETNRIWQYSDRRMDRYGLQQASEAAAATASVIFFQSAAEYGDPNVSDPMYAYDEAYYPRRSRRRRRHSSISASQRPPTIIQMAPANTSPYAAAQIPPGVQSAPISMAGSAYGTPALAMPMQANSVAFPGGGMPSSYTAPGYAGSSYGAGYGGSVVMPPPHRRHRSHSRSHHHRRARSNTIDTYGYGVPSYAGSAMGAPPPQVYRY